MKKLLLFACLGFLLQLKAQETELWGVNINGGLQNGGNIFRMDLDAQNISSKYDFEMLDGEDSFSVPVEYMENGKFYGVTFSGGKNQAGVLYEYDITSGIYSVLFNLDDYGIRNSYSTLILAGNGKFYGLTQQDNFNGTGSLFEFDPIANTFSVKYIFNNDMGELPRGSLCLASNGKLYGISYSGGQNGAGTIFSYDPELDIFSKQKDLESTLFGKYTIGSFVEHSNGKLYGATSEGGLYGDGTLLEYDPALNILNNIYDFDASFDGSSPRGRLLSADNGKLYGTTYNGGANNEGTLFEVDINSPYPFTVLLDFESVTKGANPNSNLMLTEDNHILGVTRRGGDNNDGIIFKYNLDSNTFTKLMDFESLATGKIPRGGLYKGNNGKYYGTTESGGGLQAGGVIFEYDFQLNDFNKLFSFLSSETGAKPQGKLLTSDSNKFYGVASKGVYNAGILYEFDRSLSTYTVLYNFDSNGKVPSAAALLDGNDIYGITMYGGTNDNGVIYRYNLSSQTYTQLLDFDELITGHNPAGFVKATNNKFYGVNRVGGETNAGILYEYDVTTNSFTKKITFFTDLDGRSPSSLVLFDNGKIYGTTTHGGAYNAGILFEFDPLTDSYSKLLDFEPASMGGIVNSPVVQGDNGVLYGVSSYGGANNKGTLFAYDYQNNLFVKLFDFNDTTGYRSRTKLVFNSNNKLLGFTYLGGANGVGTMFEYDILDQNFIVKHDYTVDEGFSPGTELISVVNTLSIDDDISNQDSFVLYPNPAKDKLYVRGNEPITSIAIYDMSGKLVISENKVTDAIDISGLTPGLYMVQGYADDNTFYKKLIVE